MSFFNFINTCHSHVLSHFSIHDIFNCLQYIYAKVFIFYSHLKMALERSKRRDLLAFIFITKSISKKLLLLLYYNSKGVWL